MRYYRVEIVFNDGSGLTYDTYAENALCAVFQAGRDYGDNKPISVIVHGM